MKQAIGGNGQDTTSALVTFLRTHSQLYLANLYMIGEIGDSRTFFLTDWPSPLSWTPWGAFQPASIRRKTVTSDISLTVQTFDMEWTPPPTSFGVTVGTMNPYQLAMFGLYDNWRVRVWRTFMPTPGDANTYGAVELFGGRVSQTTVERGNIKWTVNSFLDVINEKVPPNVIESMNTLAGFKGATPPPGFSVVPQFVAVAPSSNTNILGDCTSPSAGHIFGTNDFRYGYMVFAEGTANAGLWSPIATSGDFNAGLGVHYNQFVIYTPFPSAPTPGDAFYVSAAFPVNLQDGNYFGLPYVPAPETAI